jgi:hypothetical protein
MKLVINLPQHALRNQAMVAAGLDPALIGRKPGNRVHTDRKKAAARGHQKHKGRMYD